MNEEEFVKEQMKLSKEDIIANYWYTYQDNVERLGIENQLKLKDKEIERLKESEEYYRKGFVELYKRIEKANEYIKVCKSNDMGIRYQRIEEILQGVDKE